MYFCTTSPEGALRPRLFTDMSGAVSDYHCCSVYGKAETRLPIELCTFPGANFALWGGIKRRIEEEGVEHQKGQPMIQTWICSLAPSSTSIVPVDSSVLLQSHLSSIQYTRVYLRLRLSITRHLLLCRAGGSISFQLEGEAPRRHLRFKGVAMCMFASRPPKTALTLCNFLTPTWPDNIVTGTSSFQFGSSEPL